MPRVIEVTPRSLEEAREAQDSQATLGVVVSRSLSIFAEHAVVRFYGKPLVLVESAHPFKEGATFRHYVHLSKERFEGIAYRTLGGLTRAQLSDVFAYVISMAPDVSGYGHLFLLGDRVWDSRSLAFVDSDPEAVVWRSPYAPTPADGPVGFLLDAAKGDRGVYEDMLQSMAAILMEKKPYGVFWWVGDGANGKSSLMEALYRLFPSQLCSLTVRTLTDGRDTPALNGHLANVVKESSEGKVEDTQIYKSIGTHEDFQIHKFHSQESMTIRGNMHHIFSANQVPTFNDKGFSARRRTFIIPFRARFSGDPTFEERTFTPEVLGNLLAELLRVAVEVASRDYCYKFSQITEGAKADYDGEANNAEDYARALLAEGIVAFDSFQAVRVDYENWCADQGYVPLGVTNMRRAVQGIGFERRSVKAGFLVDKRYVVKSVDPKDMVELGFTRRGFYTAPGFRAPEPEVEPEIGQQTLADW